jgi:hypothetical protein
MDMREYDYNVHHRGDDLRREMEHYRLVDSLAEPRPSLFARLRTLFGRAASVQTDIPTAQPVASPKRAAKPAIKTAAVVATAKSCQPETA